MTTEDPTPPATTPPSRELVATCWTSAGSVRPGDDPEVSPLDPHERVRAVATGGWYGMGFAQGDLERIEATTGFADLAAEIRAAGLRHVEVELLTEWWRPREEWNPRWELLGRSATALGASVVKIGSRLGDPVDDLEFLVEPARVLAEEAAALGFRLALEPLPFAVVGSVPAAADLARRVAHPAFGLCVDVWHVFRAGTTLEELATCLAPRAGTGDAVAPVHCVELNDADPAPAGSLYDDTRDHRRYPGEGSFDLPGFVDVLRGAGFSGPWGVEMLSHEHRRTPLPEALDRARTSAATVL